MLQREMPPQVASGDYNHLEIRGPDKSMYGILAAQTNGPRAFVIHNNRIHLTVMMQDNTANTLSVTSQDGSTVASMSPQEGQGDRLELRIAAGVCPLLILSPILAVLILM